MKTMAALVFLMKVMARNVKLGFKHDIEAITGFIGWALMVVQPVGNPHGSVSASDVVDISAWRARGGRVGSHRLGIAPGTAAQGV